LSNVRVTLMRGKETTQLQYLAGCFFFWLPRFQLPRWGMAPSSSFLLRPIKVGTVCGSKAKESSRMYALRGPLRMHGGERTLNLTVPLKSCAVNDPDYNWS
jgi:hypothetical protein